MADKKEEKTKKPETSTKAMIKKDDKKDKIEKILQVFTESMGASRDGVEEYIDLTEKKKLTQKEEKRRDELQLEIAKANGLQNGIWAANLSYGKYFKFLATTRSNLVKEYDCKTPLELMLVDRIVANYWRSMKLDMILNRLIETEEGGYSFNDSKMNVIRELGKGLESASRQLNTSILFLKELKQPKLNVKVNTENAFIGQNQQFNVNKQNEQQQDEIIEPK